MKKTAFIFLIFIILLGFSLKCYSLIGPVDQGNPEQVMVEIKKGMTGKDISQLLEKKGLIKSSSVFYVLLRLKGINNLKAGYYKFLSTDSLFIILTKIRQGQEEIFQLTIPEGFTVAEVIKRFNELDFPDYKASLLQKELSRQAAAAKLFQLDFLQSGDLIEPAEGLIIPDTYNFPLSYTEKQLAAALIGDFKTKRLPELKQAALNSEYSAYQILIIASLIEAEGKIAAERKIIASVIYNRLALGMPLQLDATVQYLLPERKTRILYSDLEVKSPYNTYQIKGLPPAPISNPGDSALQAAFKPAATDYLFYFAKKDGSHVFSKNYQEHLQKQQDIN
ncbi:endolytic transglycosylase MltG [Halanaerobium salsuginis]|uniref:Endolytic murein transglycosylase n=1 Tax=Halanaerobium salsuginis TaxID=29563 RepID=A0A1I4EQD0_9FIRM|nr:endolytic transglycosylase MltG [Halanaerobium salsuginis]SFL07952.1 UPF0755 protein [Halanaerobium salsuginis]